MVNPYGADKHRGQSMQALYTLVSPGLSSLRSLLTKSPYLIYSSIPGEKTSVSGNIERLSQLLVLPNILGDNLQAIISIVQKLAPLLHEI